MMTYHNNNRIPSIFKLSRFLPYDSEVGNQNVRVLCVTSTMMDAAQHLFKYTNVL